MTTIHSSREVYYCIRFLLDGNKENQDFVAKLEAKKVVDDDTLKKLDTKLRLQRKVRLS